MSKKKPREIAGTVADATLPKTLVEIGGKTYNLCLDLGALAEAETQINRELLLAGRRDQVNLLGAMIEENLANVRIIFAAAMRKFNPEVSYEEALAMVRPDTLFPVALALRDAWRTAMPEAKPDDPSEAQATK